MSGRRRWVCPECGAGKLLGARPAADATDLYCLPCSVKTGSLVRRTCPVAEKKKAATAERARERAARKRARERARATFAGVHVELEVQRVLRVARRLRPSLPARVGEVTVYRRDSGSEISGFARRSGARIHLGIGRDAGTADVLAVIAHEVGHIYEGQRRTDGDHHPDTYWSALAELCLEAYGVDLPVLYGTAWGKQELVRRAFATAHRERGLPHA